MIVQLAKRSHAEQMFVAFQSSQVTRKNLSDSNVSKTGFFEYQMPFEEFCKRIDVSDNSLVLISGGRLEAYILAYPIDKSSQYPDAVRDSISQRRPDAVYLDQLWVRQGIGVYTLARLMDVFDDIMRQQNVQTVTGAVVIAPEYNHPSLRFSLMSGFNRIGYFNDPKAINFVLLEKPYWKIGEEIKS